MHWNSLSEFLAMGDQGLYVWGALGGMAMAMVLELFQLIRRRKNLMIRLEKQCRTEIHRRDQYKDHTSISGGIR